MKIKRFEFNMFPENCYVLWDETLEAVVIDPGCFYEEEKQALKNFIISNGLQVKHLLNTHLHLDHIFGNPFMLKEFGLKAEANQADEFWIDEAPKQSRMFGFQLPEPPVPLGTYLHDGDIRRHGSKRSYRFHRRRSGETGDREEQDQLPPTGCHFQSSTVLGRTVSCILQRQYALYDR